MSKIHLELEVPEEVKQIEKEFQMAAQESLLEAAALRLYEKGEISSGYAAAMLGMTRWEFIQLLGKRGIPFIDYDEAEAAREIRMVEQEIERLAGERKSH